LKPWGPSPFKKVINGGKLNSYSGDCTCKEGEIRPFHPPNWGWLEKKLNKKEVDYVWKCIEGKKSSCKNRLVGVLDDSYDLVDRGNWFWENTLFPLVQRYAQEFGNMGARVPVNQVHPYYLQSWWVNYMKKGDYNPIHDHTGLYSFVLWMQIPSSWKEEMKNPLISNTGSQSINTFEFVALDLLGGFTSFQYRLNPTYENLLVFFPSRLHHTVFPFYHSDGERISIAGNISVNTAKTTSIG
tara:strand:+ start:330 stop:1052 length:723 start_codon:yes stop_codon:yes gene_type:complete